MSKRMILNPNADIVSKIIHRIQINDGKCPCQSSTCDIDTRCPCNDFMQGGVCHCSLFVEAKDE